jgi:hypothetical protein
MFYFTLEYNIASTAPFRHASHFERSAAFAINNGPVAV